MNDDDADSLQTLGSPALSCFAAFLCHLVPSIANCSWSLVDDARLTFSCPVAEIYAQGGSTLVRIASVVDKAQAPYAHPYYWAPYILT